MMGFTFLFPGQGSQAVGMGKDFYSEFESARKRFDSANEILQRDLLKIIFEGPQEELTATQNTQPALFLVESVIADILNEKGITPSFTAGHSLGEYSALYAAGVVSFSDGLKAVARRGEYMAKAGKATAGTMAAVIGLPKGKIAEVLQKVSSGVVVPANENTPEQTVISGEVPAVNEACTLLKEAGAKRAMVLPVSGAFHSPLMQSAADEFAQVLDTITFSKPRCPVITNVTAKPETDPVLMKSLLVKQLVSPVRWVDSMQTLAGLNFGTCCEVGPGSVVKGLVKKCQDSLNVISCDTVTNIYSLLTNS
ncbi:MAG TPA: ACP S-malonyltransferase [Chitinispirillaceae bacterium]|nr:ACP S-malonyltransferase [Chitinispirillaceae bacterium]